MRADLYIDQVHRPLVERYRPLFDAAVQRRNALPAGSRQAQAAQQDVDRYYHRMYSAGYFRDSYNATNVLSRLDLSWWRDVTPLCTAGGQLQGENLRRFRQMVASAPLRLPSKQELEADHARVDDDGNSLAEWHRYFTEKRAELLEFLDQAIALDTAVTCSL